ncbi:MAG: hypothetical protein KAT43_06115 [Nanoarchaeota archaeon]|nr:hypothetical protein [Nanoarchaeota archaeon]
MRLSHELYIFLIFAVVAFISLSGLAVETSDMLTGMAAACQPNWQCTSWYPACVDGEIRSSSVLDLGFEGISNRVKRGCIDMNNCGTNVGRPTMSAHCVTRLRICTANWQCTEWSLCRAGQQTRSCYDANKCNSLQDKPKTTKSCLTQEMIVATGSFGGSTIGVTQGESRVTFPAAGGPVSGTFSARTTYSYTTSFESGGSMTINILSNSAGKLSGTFAGGEGGAVTGTMSGWVSSEVTTTSPHYNDRKTYKEPIYGTIKGTVSLKKGLLTGTWEQPILKKAKLRGTFTMRFTPVDIPEEDTAEDEQKAEEEKQRAEEQSRLAQADKEIAKEMQELEKQRDAREAPPAEPVPELAGEPVPELAAEPPPAAETRDEAKEREEKEKEYKEALEEKERLDKEEKDSYKDPKELEKEIKEAKQALDYLEKSLNNLEKITTDKELKKLVKLGKKDMKKMKKQLDAAKMTSDIINILTTEGPSGDWRDIECEDVKPGWWTKKMRGLTTFWKGDREDWKRGGEIADLYKAMAAKKDDQDFWAMNVPDRLASYLYQKIASKVKGDAKEKAEELITKVIGKSRTFSTGLITGSLQTVFDESKKPDIGKFYRSYSEYRHNPWTGAKSTHAQAMENIMIDIEQDSYLGMIPPGAGKGIRPAGAESITESKYFGVEDRTVLFEAVRKVYDANNPQG